MQYNGLVIGSLIVALIVLIIALRLLFKGNWILGWLRGTAGMLGVVMAVLTALVAYDFSSYQPLPPAGSTLVTVSFSRAADQSYDVTLESETNVGVVPLSGDLWQLDVRVLRWKGLGELIGLQPGYRLARLDGRFLSAEQQAVAAETSQVMLSSSPLGVDLWAWLREHHRDFGLFDAWGGRVNFQPMADRAVYEVRLTSAGLMVEPVNVAAREAAAGW